MEGKLAQCHIIFIAVCAGYADTAISEDWLAARHLPAAGSQDNGPVMRAVRVAVNTYID